MGNLVDYGDNKYISFYNFKPKSLKYVGSIGLDGSIQSDTILSYLKSGLYESKRKFNDFVESTYRENCDWGSYIRDDELGIALYARILVGLSLHYKLELPTEVKNYYSKFSKKDSSGKYIVYGDIPKKVKEKLINDSILSTQLINKLEMYNE